MTGMYDRGFERAAENLPDDEPMPMPIVEYKKTKSLREIDVRILVKA